MVNFVLILTIWNYIKILYKLYMFQYYWAVTFLNGHCLAAILPPIKS